MKTEKKRKNIHHRLFKIVKQRELAHVIPDSELCAAELLWKAHQIHKGKDEKLECRERIPGETENYAVLSSENEKECGVFTGMLYTTLNGQKVPAQSKMEQGRGVISAQPMVDDQPCDPAKNIIYFSLNRNELAYFSDSSSADTKLSDFFDWLLIRDTGVVHDFYGIELEARIPINIRERMNKEHVRKIKFNSEVEATVLNGWGSRIKEFIFSHQGSSNQIISTQHDRRNALMGCHVTVEVTTGTKDRGVKKEAMAFFCSKLQDEQLKCMSLVLGDGTVIKCGEMAIARKVDISYNDGVPDNRSVKGELEKYLNDNTLKNLN